MKALVLAAGFGTRLKPFTDHTPKALFPYDGRPLLDKIIEDLAGAGFKDVLINTHHLAGRIHRHVAGRNYPISVATRHEPEILGTGGAIRNAADFLDDRPFLVVNSDVVTDFDFSELYRFHAAHPFPATLVLVDHPDFNAVPVDGDFFVRGFGGPGESPDLPGANRLTFTGVQVLDRCCLNFIPPGTFSSSIAAYRKMIAAGRKIAARVIRNDQWQDIGSPERYTAAVIRTSSARAFQKAFPRWPGGEIRFSPLKGDGSDRKWSRLSAHGRTLIMAEHGIRKGLQWSEVDAYVAIGRHLYGKGVPVPKIVLADSFSGVVYLEDLGEEHLNDVIAGAADHEAAFDIYRQIVDIVIRMFIRGAEGFDPKWPYQTACYDAGVVLDQECRYFVEAFLNGYMSDGTSFADLQQDFSALAAGVTACANRGFMHRDLQSRNIMVQNGRYFFIDFQGGRLGPVQYDLASLLLDPYVALSSKTRNRLLDYAAEKAETGLHLDRKGFLEGFHACALSRNLQILGAFAFLSRVKKKTGFEKYIPPAVKSLASLLRQFDTGRYPLLKKTVARVEREVSRWHR